MNRATGSDRMERIVALCRRRGFVFQSSEIYGGINGFWDFGPLGILLKNNLRDRWWNDMVIHPPAGPTGEELQILGIDCSIISHPKVWEASGHVGSFSDPMQTCRQCKKLFRADHVWEALAEADWTQSLADLLEDHREEGLTGRDLKRWAEKQGKKLAPGLHLVRDLPGTVSWLVDALQAQGEALERVDLVRLCAAEDAAAAKKTTPCPNCGGGLTEPREFNLMFETRYGAVRDEDHKTYLRPETAQGMFYNFKNILDSSRVRVPFGLAQIGKGFRNEVTPRNFIFRSREFEMMEVEFFCHPDEAKDWYSFWRDLRFAWWQTVGLPREELRLRDHAREELAHYAKESGACADVEFAFPFSGEAGYSELEGIAHRTDYDLTQHAKASGAKLRYFDIDRKEHFVPHVIEPAAGLTRGLLALLAAAYDVDESRPSPELMRFQPSLAPIKAGVFPLVNKDGLPEIARRIYQDVRREIGVAQFDEKQSIGKRYARMDEAGTPYCITVDGTTKEDGTVTVRDRDTGHQDRIAADNVVTYLQEQIG